MNIGLTTELDAINTMLSIIGEAPVNTIEDTGVVDAVIARQILTETSRQVQAQGWSWNTDASFPLVPSFPLPGEVFIPANTLSIDPVEPARDIVVRGNRLWDRKRHSHAFDGEVKVNLTLLLPFEELPQTARHYIMVRAGRIFQDRVVGSSTLSGFNAVDETKALVQLRNAEAEVADYNVLRDSYSVARVMDRRSGRVA